MKSVFLNSFYLLIYGSEMSTFKSSSWPRVPCFKASSFSHVELLCPWYLMDRRDTFALPNYRKYWWQLSNLLECLVFLVFNFLSWQRQSVIFHLVVEQLTQWVCFNCKANRKFNSYIFPPLQCFMILHLSFLVPQGTTLWSYRSWSQSGFVFQFKRCWGLELKGGW